jgi:anthranilate/para-aminobenzoate synthase component II
MNYDVPTLGVCHGYEIIAVAHLGRIKKLEKLLQKALNINTHVRNVEGVNELGYLMRRTRR